MEKFLVNICCALVFMTGGLRGYADEKADINGIKYILHDSTATVKGWSSYVLSHLCDWKENGLDNPGVIIIPEQFHYEGENFTVTAIDASFCYMYLSNVIIPRTVKSITGSFETDHSSLEIISYIEDPFPTTFTVSAWRWGSTLYVPRGKKQAYVDAGWASKFTNGIVEFGPIVEEDYIFEVDELRKEASVSCNNKEKLSGHVVLPTKTTWDGKDYTVTGIGEEGFSGCEGITTIEMPGTVTTIGKSAFYGCSNLKSVSIQDGVSAITIKENTFANCPKLSKISFGRRDMKEISRSAFSGNQIDTVCLNSPDISWSENLLRSCKVKVLYIGSNVQTIDYVTINGSGTSLEEINVDASWRFSMRDSVVFDKDCTTVLLYPNIKKSKYYTIPSTVKTIAGHSFGRVKNVEEVIIPSSVKNIKPEAFLHCQLKRITIPNSVETIGVNGFCGCTNLEEVTLSRAMTVIDEYTFDGCSNLIHIELPSKLQKIRGHAFNDCSKLESIILPKSMVYIGAEAFNKCDALKDIYCLAETPPKFGNYEAFSDYSATLHVPVGSKDAYMSATYWKKFTTIVEDDFTGIQSPLVKKGEQSPWYDLQGRPVTRPEKGRIYIHDGRKVVK